MREQGHGGERGTAGLTELERAVGILREEHALDGDLDRAVRDDELGDPRMDEPQAIGEWPARSRDAALRDDAQRAALAVDDAEAGAQTAGVETEDARTGGRQHPHDRRCRRVRVGTVTTPG